MKKQNNKKKMKLWEKIFIIISIIIIIGIISVYAYRAVYYYKKLNYIKPNSKLVDVITNQNNIVYENDGLYKLLDNTYYYKGINVDNYLYYSGMLWRIIGIDEAGIEIITNDNITSLVWGNNTNFEKSIVFKWLNEDKFINSLINTDNLVSINWCNSYIDINDYNCSDYVFSNIGLISTKEYLLAGGINSYLFNQSYFWTINYSKDFKAYYIHSEGGINNDIGANDSLHSYGVRPVIYLNKDVLHISGDGTQDKPYVILANGSASIGNQNIGAYIKYNNLTWRINDKTNEYTKLILDGYITKDGDELKMSYDKVKSYLDDTFINNFNKDDLVKIKYNRGEFNLSNNYNYLKVLNSYDAYIGLPNIGDLFITEYENNWLDTYYSTSENLIYTTDKYASLIADLSSSPKYIRPVITVKNSLIITSGEGTSANPFVIGDENEVNN